MNLEDFDIVYMVKDAIYNEELRYSLRSVEKNFPHKRVVFIGGKPMYCNPDKQIVVNQKGATKWDRVRAMLKQIAETDDITENFVLFNDDFFIMEPVTELPPYRYGTLQELCQRIERKNKGRPTKYTLSLEKTIKALEEKGLPTINFELHMPILLNRGKLLEVIERFPEVKGTRSLYGNSYLVSFSKPMKDVKIFGSKTVPSEGQLFLSTDDVSFANGEVGRFIREAFPDKSKFEK